MHKWVLAGALAVGAAALAQPAQAAAGFGASAPAVTAAPSVVQAQPVYWVWHGRHWNHRRWAPRLRVGGRWVPGHYTYY